MPSPLETLLAARPVVLLDGATGTELQRRGVQTTAPLWTAEAARDNPKLLERIHLDYLEAGADIVTANTFRTTPYTLRALGRDGEAARLTLQSVEAARRACDSAGHGLVAGSMAPLEDCFHPERVPAADILLREHALHARSLQQAGVDLLLVETMNTAREAHDAALGALETGLPVLVSLILDPERPGELLSGEDLEVAWAHIRPLPVAGFLVNCTPRTQIEAALERMQWSGDSRPLGAYANCGSEGPDGEWAPDGSTPPEAYAQSAVLWRSLGARIIGGCCGTTPAHLRAVHAALRRA